MKKTLLLLIAVSSMARSYDNYSCDDLYRRYKSDYNDASGQYSYRKQDAYRKYCSEVLGKAPDKGSYFIEEPEDQVKFLEIQKRTLGVACSQIEQGLQISYKHEYCNILRSFDVEQVSQNTSKPMVNEIKPIQRKQIDPAVQYKKAPQLKLSDLQIYGVTNIRAFRDQKEIIMIESSTGNFALPKSKIMSAERINFTPELSQKIDVLIY